MDTDRIGKTCRLLWLAFALSLWVYWAAAWALSGDTQTPAAETGLAVGKWFFLAASLLPIGVIAFLRKLVYERKIKPGPDHSGWPQLMRNTVIVSYAFAETPAVFGLIVFFFTRQWPDFYLFLSVSAAALAYFYPRELP